MARRITITRNCDHEGCRERTISTYSSRREYNDWGKSSSNKPWLCNRHREPDEVISMENPRIVTIIEAAKSERHPNPKGLFWRKEGILSSGFIYGPGFQAYADDFPEGTKLEITVKILTDSNK